MCGARFFSYLNQHNYNFKSKIITKKNYVATRKIQTQQYIKRVKNSTCLLERGTNNKCGIGDIKTCINPAQ